jgi:hypothetical protein
MTAWTRAAASLAVLALTTGCGGGHTPERLSDGSTPPRIPGGLHGVGRALMTGVRVIRGLDLEQKPYVDCIGELAGGAPTVAVERVTASGRTLTFATPDRRLIVGCDGAAQSREPSGSWCGETETRWLGGGRVEDARLDLANCLDGGGATVAYAWAEPFSRARWLVVKRDGYREIYELSGPLPVRVATTDGIDEKTSRATIDVAWYGADGSKLAQRTLKLQVAG